MNFQVAINYNFVGKLSHGDPRWREFNNSFQSVEVNAWRLAAEIYKGHAFCAPHSWVSHRKESKRKDGTTFEYDGAYRDFLNFRCLQTAALDFDGGAQEDSIASLLLDPFISKRAAILYSTASSTPEKPRTRVVFVLEEPITDLEDAHFFCRALTGHYERADPSGSDVMKAWSGSLRCRVVLNEDAFIPSSIVSGMIWQLRRKQEELAEKRRRYLDGTSLEEIETRVRDALKWVPKQMDYKDWLTTVMAIWTVRPDERGIAIAEEWSPGYEGEVARIFRHCRDVRVTADWIFAVAYNRGWRDEAHQQGADDLISELIRLGGI